MATNFDNNALSSSGGFKPSTKDTPIDIRSRVATETDILEIPNPYVGLIIYVQDTGKRFEVLSIKDVQSGLSKVSRVDMYKEIIMGSSSEVDLDSLVAKNEVGNANQIIFSDNQSLQSKLDSGTLQGPKGDTGEQGIQGETGATGPAGVDGKTPVKGVDYFTSEDKVEMLNGYATESFVNNAIANAQLGGEDGEVNLEGLVAKNEIGNASQILFNDGQSFQTKLDNGSLQGPKGDTGEKGIQGIQGEKGDKGDDGLTTSIIVNGQTFTNENGVITLPNYPQAGTSVDTYSREEIDNIVEDYTGGKKQRYVTNEQYEKLTSSEKNDSNIVYNITDAESNTTGNVSMIFEDVIEGEIFTSFTDNISEQYPCTALSYNVSSLTFATNSPQSLILTIEPSNCTDDVNVSVNPEGIVSVTDNVVTPLSNGDCTINATCGTKTASCTVAVSCFETMYTITNKLTNVNNSNQSVSIAEGVSYVATISPKDNFELQSCIITMGGVDITDTVYNNGNINIPSVNGDVVITASASMSSNSGGAMLSFVEDGDSMYYELNSEMYRIKHKQRAIEMFSSSPNSYKNDTYGMHILMLLGIGKDAGVVVNKEGLFSLMPQALVINASQAEALSSTVEVPDEQFLVAYYGGYSLRKPVDDTISATEYCLDKLGETFKLPVEVKPSTIFTVDPNQLTAIRIETNDDTAQYVQMTYAANGPSDNIYSGFNTLFIYTGQNLNLSNHAPGCATAGPNKISIKFFPGTFADLTLEAVKEYLTQNPLTFYRV